MYNSSIKNINISIEKWNYNKIIEEFYDTNRYLFNKIVPIKCGIIIGYVNKVGLRENRYSGVFRGVECDFDVYSFRNRVD